METAAVGYTPTLAKRAKKHMAENKLSIQALADILCYSRPAISQYLSGKYSSDPSEIENKLKEYLNEQAPLAEQDNISTFPAENVIASIKKRNDFFESVDARNVIGICRACQQYSRMGVIVGASGYGKTQALKHFANLPQVVYIRCNAIMGHRDLVRTIENAVGIPKSYGSVTERLNGIIKFFNVNEGYLLVVDEADKLLNKNTQTKMDSLRDIYDNSHVGIVLAGEKALKSMISAYLDRMENRIAYSFDMQGLDSKQLDKYLVGYNIEPGARAELQRRAYGGGKSCFRLLDITLSNVFDLLEEKESAVITLETIRQASNWMPL